MMLDDLKRRGLMRQATFDQLDRPVTFYVGFDPTADSLHVGHLIAVTAARRLIQAGNKAIILIGDATASIGDPSGKRVARPMLTPAEINANANSIENQIMRLLSPETAEGEVRFVRNRHWFDEETFLDFARDIGSCFSVNVMLRAECFKARLGEGLTFLELSYMLMQAYDFLHLHEEYRCDLQVGGDDQWSNILAGIDLIRRKSQVTVYGFTLPLLVNSDGTKMGKTENGTVWLSPTRTSPNAFFQFWRNIPDDKVVECFKSLSFNPMNAIEAWASTPPNPSFTPEAMNEAKKSLAFEMTEMVHGKAEAERALKQAEDFFESRDPSTAESVRLANGADVLDALVACGFARSRTDGRNLVEGKGVSLNGTPVEDPYLKIERSRFGDEPVLRKGKKNIRRLRLEG